MEVLHKTEYRLVYQEDDSTDVKYFNEEQDVWKFISANNLFTYAIIKEELIASRYDAKI